MRVPSTRAGMRIIGRTKNLRQILARNAAAPADAVPRSTYAPEGRRAFRPGG